MMYNYENLKMNALKVGASKEDRLALLEWFEQYGMDFWNGECYDLENGKCLYPIYEEVEEDVFDIVDAEIR